MRLLNESLCNIESALTFRVLRLGFGDATEQDANKKVAKKFAQKVIQ